MKQKIAKVLGFFCVCWFCLWCTLGLLLAFAAQNDVARSGHADIFLSNVTYLITAISVFVTLFRIPKLLGVSKYNSPRPAANSGNPSNNERPQKQVWELERKKEREQEYETEQELASEAATPKQPVIKTITSAPSATNTRPLKIIHIDDEDWLLEMVRLIIKKNKAFTNVTIKPFQNRDEAWRELLQTEPDLLITDLRSDNIPMRTEHFGMSGFELLSLLAKKGVNYPILVFSGSLSRKDHESYARQCAGNELNVTLLAKPATVEQLNIELARLICPDKTSVARKVQYQDYRTANKSNEAVENKADTTHQYSGLTKEQQDYLDEAYNGVGKPNAALQLELDELLASKTESELKQILSRTINIERPKAEAELFCAVTLTKLTLLRANK